MGVTLRSFILSVALIVIAAIVYQLSNKRQLMDEAEIMERYPTFTATNFSGDNFDKTGKLIHHLEAQTVIFYQNRDLLLLSKPDGIYYNYGSKKDYRQAEPWQLSANQGRVVLNQEAELKGEVKLKALFANSPISNADTSYLHFDMQKNLITTPEKVRISGPNFVNYGHGLRADMNDKKVYLNDPHARYEFN